MDADDDDADEEDDNEDAMVSNVGSSSNEAAATTVADVTRKKNKSKNKVLRHCVSYFISGNIVSISPIPDQNFVFFFGET